MLAVEADLLGGKRTGADVEHRLKVGTTQVSSSVCAVDTCRRKMMWWRRWSRGGAVFEYM